MDKQFLYYSNGKSVEVSQKVFEALVESDNKIRYFEHDLKVDRTVRKGDQLVRLPSREDSLERLMDLHIQFADESADVMAEVERTMMLDKLQQCLALLDAAELELIRALYFEGYSVRGWAEKKGIPTMTVQDKKVKVLGKCKHFMNT